MPHLSRRILNIALLAFLGVMLISSSFLLVRRENSSQQRVLGTTDTARPVSEQVAELKKQLAQSFKKFDHLISAKQMTTAHTELLALQDYEQQILSLWPRLTSTQKAELAGTCVQHTANFETNLHLLPETSHMDGMLVASGCEVIQGDAQ